MVPGTAGPEMRRDDGGAGWVLGMVPFFSWHMQPGMLGESCPAFAAIFSAHDAPWQGRAGPNSFSEPSAATQSPGASSGMVGASLGWLGQGSVGLPLPWIWYEEPFPCTTALAFCLLLGLLLHSPPLPFLPAQRQSMRSCIPKNI